MTTLTKLQAGALNIDKKWFALFLLLQVLLLAGSLFISEFVLYLAAAGLAASLFAVLVHGSSSRSSSPPPDWTAPAG